MSGRRMAWGWQMRSGCCMMSCCGRGRPGMKELDINARTRNALIRSTRCMGERGFALLTQRWQTLQHITASPGKIGQIARAALVLVLFEHKMLT